MKTVTDVSINNGVETISEYAFYDLPALKSVALPSSVSSVGEYAFALSAESTEAVCVRRGQRKCSHCHDRD